MTRRTLIIAAVWVAPSALLLALAYAVQAHFYIAEATPLSGAGRVEVVRVLRAALSERTVKRSDHSELTRRLGEDRPVGVGVWLDGRERARAWGRGPTLADALVDVGAKLLDSRPLRPLLSAKTLARAYLKIDIVTGRGPIVTSVPLLRALGLHPGLEGLGVRATLSDPEDPDDDSDSDSDSDKANAKSPTPSKPTDRDLELLLLPEDLIGHRLLIGEKPLSFVPDFRIGLDFARTSKHLTTQARRAAKWSPAHFTGARKRYFRFRTESFLASAGAPAAADADDDMRPIVPLLRGLGPPPEVSAERLRSAAIEGGRYLVAHLADNGRYIYERDLFTGRGSNPKGKGAYSIPRHAGTTYFLAELYRLTGEQFLREPIERAFAHLSQLIEASGCQGELTSGAPFACVADKGHSQAHLGSTALTVVALVEYRRATGDDRYDDMARKLTEWILFMQRPDGSFTHVYQLKGARKLDDKQLLYYSGEAALALARMHAAHGDERYRDGAERALDHLIGWYDFFMGGFFFGEEHWTCIAAEALYPAVKKASYVDFCHGFAGFLRDQQVGADDVPGQPYLAGSYNITPFLVPMNTPAGSKTESMISTYLLGRAHGRPDRAVRRQIDRALAFLLGQQIRHEHAYFIPRSARGPGAVPGSPVDWTVRIDYVQHVCSAMIRAAELIESDQR